MFSIVAYKPEMARQWDELVATASSGTFLHRRGYMDYHADRFRDASLVALNAKGQPVAVLPANAAGDTLYSHQGLTYGGWLVNPRKVGMNAMLEIWEAALAYLRERGFKRLIYKAVPYIYDRYPCDEPLYCLFRSGASISCVNIASCVDLREPLHFNLSSRNGANKAEKAGITVRRSDDLAPFWAMLEAVLRERHGARPVHTLEEMTLLKGRFPEQIQLVGAYNADGALIAGTLLYLTDTVAHSQYIATTAEGRETHALNLLFRQLVPELAAQGYRYLDFGTSNEDGGRVLNAGLSEQKDGMGGRGVAYATYSLAL